MNTAAFTISLAPALHALKGPIISTRGNPPNTTPHRPCRSSRPTPLRLTLDNSTPSPSAPPILAGDLVVHRAAQGAWELSAVWHVYGNQVELVPVHSRSVDSRGRHEVFIDWPHFDTGKRVVTREQEEEEEEEEMIALDIDFETRVIEDRISNPHGEESEDCWFLSSTDVSNWSISL